MSFSFIYLPSFEKSLKRLAKKYPSLIEDLKSFKDEYTINPNMGDDLGGNIRKVRLQIKAKGKGKSAGARVITFNALISKEKSEVILVFIYDKSERESMSVHSLKMLLRDSGL